MKMVEANNYVPYKTIIVDHDFCKENQENDNVVLEQIFPSR